MNLIKRQLSLAAMLVTGLVGQFGNDVRPRGYHDNQTIGGSYRGGKNGRTKRPATVKGRRQILKGKGHRRSYLCGKAGFR